MALRLLVEKVDYVCFKAYPSGLAEFHFVRDDHVCLEQWVGAAQVAASVDEDRD
jgi:hypothetical protein